MPIPFEDSLQKHTFIFFSHRRGKKTIKDIKQNKKAKFFVIKPSIACASTLMNSVLPITNLRFLLPNSFSYRLITCLNMKLCRFYRLLREKEGDQCHTSSLWDAVREQPISWFPGMQKVGMSPACPCEFRPNTCLNRLKDSYHL